MRFFEVFSVRRARLAAQLAGLVLASAVAAPATAQTPVFFGDIIDQSGVYFLAGNQSGAGDGITIASDDVALLLGRFTLRGDGLGNGITVDGHDRVSIFGGRITEFRFGIRMDDAEDCTIKDTRIDDCGDGGLFLFAVYESSFLRLRCDNNHAEGVLALNSYENRFVSILAHDNDFDGIFILNEAAGMSKEYNNKVRLCWAAYNGGSGIHVTDSEENQITQNQCVNNSRAGIHLETRNVKTDDLGGIGPARDNEVSRNWCVFNRVGILVGDEATDNALHDNIALANSDRDVVDDNDAPPCENTWFLNLFLSKGGDGAACIF